MDHQSGSFEIIVTFVLSIVVFIAVLLCVTAGQYTKVMCEVQTTNAIDKTACIIQHRL